MERDIPPNGKIITTPRMYRAEFITRSGIYLDRPNEYLLCSGAVVVSVAKRMYAVR